MTQGLRSTSYRTTDLALAASLLSCRCPMTRIDKTAEATRAVFVFNLTPEQEKYIDAFWQDALKLNPRIFFDNVKLLKNRLYSER